MLSNRGHWIDGAWTQADGDPFASINPASQDTIWQGSHATAGDVDAAFDAARRGLEVWSDVLLERRMAICQDFATRVTARAEEFATLLSDETGKPRWEAKTEVAAVAGKINLAIAALQERRWTTTVEMPGANAIMRFKPYGVMGVLGPFNLPAHLPNGHIVPAILAGNSVVFKPSEETPATGQFMMEIWDETELPSGVINLVQGGRDTGAAIVAHQQLDGLLFTGSSNAGLHFLRRFAEHPEKILALEMGGNNPLVVNQTANIRGAAYQTILSAYITAGQRCTCARRLIIVENDQTDEFVATLTTMIGGIRTGLPTENPEPFLGTLISDRSASIIRQAYQELLNAGATPLVELRDDDRSQALLHPALLDVTDVKERRDHEWFGPLLQIIRVPSFEAAIEEANQTSYGLAAGLLSDSRDDYELFLKRIRAGIVNWNRQTTGASGRLPFGGVGHSGNHHPSGYFACDYCSYPVASLESDTADLPEKAMPGLEALQA